MNTILHLTAILTSLWASIFAFQTLSEPALGGALLILFGGFIAMTFAAMDDDIFLVSGKKMLGFRGNQREPISFASKAALAITIVLLFMATFNKVGGDTKPVAILEPTAAFGEVSVAALTPIIQLQFPYSVNPRLVKSISGGSGTSSVSESLLTVSTGTTTNSHEMVESIEHAKYHPGQGTLPRWTAVYDSVGVAGTTAYAGLLNDEDGVGFGRQGTTFGVLLRHNGRIEYQTLTITNGATSQAGNITINLDGVGTAVAVENGDSIQDVVRAINAVAFDQWFDSAVGIAVEFSSHLASDKTGLFSLVDIGSTGVVGAFVEAVQGAEPTDDFIAQADWNIDNLDGDGDAANATGMLLDPSKGNVYEVQFQWLGFGSIEYQIENPVTGRFVHVHTIQYANANTATSMQNPTLPLALLVDNGATTSNITVQTSSMAVFTEGIIDESGQGIPNGAAGSADGDLTTEQPVLCIRNKNVFQGVENRVEWAPKILTFSGIGAGGAKFTTLRAVINPTVLGGPVSWSDISTATSVIEIDTSATTRTGGSVVAIFDFGKTVNAFVLDLTTFTVNQVPGEVVCFTVQTDGGTIDTDVALIWRELF